MSEGKDQSKGRGKNKPKTITHFREKCIGCGMCAYIAPEYWELSEQDGLATLKEGKKVKETYRRAILPGDEEENIVASRTCPVNIIRIN